MWLKSYLTAWKFATENGNSDLTFLPGRAGAVPRDVQPVDCTKNTKRRQCLMEFGCKWNNVNGSKTAGGFNKGGKSMKKRGGMKKKTGKGNKSDKSTKNKTMKRSNRQRGGKSRRGGKKGGRGLQTAPVPQTCVGV